MGGRWDGDDEVMKGMRKMKEKGIWRGGRSGYWQ